MFLDLFHYTQTPSRNRGSWEVASFAPTGLIVHHVITSTHIQGGNLVQCRTNRQNPIAKSTCETEFIASSETFQQEENIAIVVAEMTNKPCEIEVCNDNAASLYVIRNGSETARRTRHISVKTLWLHQMPKERDQVHTHAKRKWPQLALQKACEPVGCPRSKKT